MIRVDAAIDELDQAVCRLKDSGILGDHHDRGALFGGKPSKEIENDFCVLGIQGCRGFVGENQIGLVDECSGNRHPLALAAGEAVWAVVLSLSEAELTQQL